MNVLIVYSSRFGNTARLARSMGDACAESHAVRVLSASEAAEVEPTGLDLLVVGAPTQIHGLRLGVRAFLHGLRERGFEGMRAAAFDTRLPGPRWRTGAASDVIAGELRKAGCRLIAAPESFLVADSEGPLADGEEARGRAWALGLIASTACAA